MEQSIALPNEWVTRLFSRFQAIYGNRVATMWGDADPDEVRSTWAIELGVFEADDIKWALNSMRTSFLDYPPTLFQFAALCRDGRKRREQSVRLVAPQIAALPDAVVAKVGEFIAGKRDPRDWARNIVRRSERGEALPAISLAYADEALRGVRRSPGPTVETLREADAEQRTL